MEHKLNRKLAPTYMQYLLFISRLQMALQTLINEDIRTSEQHRVFNVKDSFVTKAFDLRVGGERVSGQNIVQEIQNEQYNQKVSVAPYLWQQYNTLETDIFRERYANCFLVSLAFCQHLFANRPAVSVETLT